MDALARVLAVAARPSAACAVGFTSGEPRPAGAKCATGVARRGAGVDLGVPCPAAQRAAPTLRGRSISGAEHLSHRPPGRRAFPPPLSRRPRRPPTAPSRVPAPSPAPSRRRRRRRGLRRAGCASSASRADRSGPPGRAKLKDTKTWVANSSRPPLHEVVRDRGAGRPAPRRGGRRCAVRGASPRRRLSGASKGRGTEASADRILERLTLSKEGTNDRSPRSTMEELTRELYFEEQEEKFRRRAAKGGARGAGGDEGGERERDGGEGGDAGRGTDVMSLGGLQGQAGQAAVRGGEQDRAMNAPAAAVADACHKPRVECFGRPGGFPRGDCGAPARRRIRRKRPRRARARRPPSRWPATRLGVHARRETRNYAPQGRPLAAGGLSTSSPDTARCAWTDVRHVHMYEGRGPEHRRPLRAFASGIEPRIADVRPRIIIGRSRLAPHARARLYAHLVTLAPGGHGDRCAPRLRGTGGSSSSRRGRRVRARYARLAARAARPAWTTTPTGRGPRYDRAVPAIVVGGSSGMGKAAALECVKRGARHSSRRARARLERARAERSTLGLDPDEAAARVALDVVDASDEASVEAFFSLSPAASTTPSSSPPPTAQCGAFLDLPTSSVREFVDRSKFWGAYHCAARRPALADRRRRRPLLRRLGRRPASAAARPSPSAPPWRPWRDRARGSRQARGERLLPRVRGHGRFDRMDPAEGLDARSHGAIVAAAPFCEAADAGLALLSRQSAASAAVLDCDGGQLELQAVSSGRRGTP